MTATDEFLNHWNETKESCFKEGDSPASPESMDQINLMIQNLLDEAPSDAVVEFKMRKANDEYLALMKICSQQGKFVGGSRQTKLLDVINEIFNEVHGQIISWREDRASRLESIEQ